MSWNDIQRIQSGLATTPGNTREILHYFPLMKGRKVIAFVLFSGTAINAEYVVISSEFRRRGSNIEPTIRAGIFDLQRQIPISELSDGWMGQTFTY